MAWTLLINNYRYFSLYKRKMPSNLKGVNKMIHNKVVAKKNIILDARQKHGRALSLLLDDMAVWFPDSYYDIEAMVLEETKGFRANRSPKIHPSDLPAKLIKNKKRLGGFNNASFCAL